MFKKIIKSFKKYYSRVYQLEKENKLLKDKLHILYNQNSIAYNRGTDNLWILIRVCLYDMYKNMEILDYGTFITSIARNLNEYHNNEQLCQQKIKQFNSDINIRKQIIRGDNEFNN